MKTPKGVQLKDISKVYLDPKTKKEFYAVDHISLDIEPGQFVTLLGPSGCGKTTTLRMIAGFESPDSGEIDLGGEAINELPPNKRDTAMVFQSYALLPHINVYQNVAYGLNIKKLPKNEIKERVTKMLELVELEGMEERMTNQLSGGQQQRVALARALVMEPGVLLFDEPLSNLDAKLRVSMRTEIRKIQQMIGITAVYVTHDQSEAMSISDQVIVMNKGVIAQKGTPREIYLQPKDKFVAQFIGEANFINGKVLDKAENEVTVELNGSPVQIPFKGSLEVDEVCEIVIRPESIVLEDEGLLPCEVILSTFMGTHQYYEVLVDGVRFTVTEYNPKSHKTYNAGDKAFLVFDVHNLHILDK
ncbi:ABC transporter ATP-binding protein [Tannockella kyphosi]|uniref:ABC transporter ATP-binding protein n=1 Tax=Tannockella kyphosi TaxID=2899121 RepID=UPI002011FFA8|nr:ABC transporter ATP-binding protein [Tannockella kyphosi]